MQITDLTRETVRPEQLTDLRTTLAMLAGTSWADEPELLAAYRRLGEIRDEIERGDV